MLDELLNHVTHFPPRHTFPLQNDRSFQNRRPFTIIANCARETSANHRDSSSATSLSEFRTYVPTKFNPSNSLLDGLNQPTTISTVPARSQSASAVKFSDSESRLAVRPSSSQRHAGNGSILKSSSTFHDDDLRSSFADDFRRMVRRSPFISVRSMDKRFV